MTVGTCVRGMLAALLAVAHVLAPGAARADVVYQEVPGLPVTYDGLVISYAGGEILLQRGQVIYPDRVTDVTYAFPSFGDAAVAAPSDGTPWLVPLAFGEPVHGYLPWNAQSGRFVETVCPKSAPVDCASTGSWVGMDRYMAIRFRQLGSTYYGWARLTHDGGVGGAFAPLVLRGIAIENTANRAVLAGARDSLPVLLRRALKVAAGIEPLAASDAPLLDRSGSDGRVDAADVVSLARLLAAV